MRYLADTHAVLWWLAGNEIMTRRAREILDEDAHDIYVSAASAWEIATKHRLGKLPEASIFGGEIEGRLRREGFAPLDVTMQHAELAGRLDGSHKDPFDRMLIAQALIEKLTLVSNDAAFDRFGVARIW